MTPTQRTIRALKDMGRTCGIVERFNPHVGQHGIRQDLFGFIDIIALDPERGIVAIQSCGSSFAGHDRKITQECHQEVSEWLHCGGQLELWGWRKVLKKRGGKARVWRPRIKVYQAVDFADPIVETMHERLRGEVSGG